MHGIRAFHFFVNLGVARKLQCRSVSAHQLTSPSANKKEKQSLPRTNSCNNAIGEDGFDIEQLDIELTEKSMGTSWVTSRQLSESTVL